jgi:group I intron endonuclease
MIVYLVTNQQNGCRYVGVTIRTIEARWREHTQRSKQNANFKLGRAIQKYGPSAFSVEVLCELDDYDDLLEAERIFVATLGAYGDRGYNMTPGGEKPPTIVKEIAARGGATRGRQRRGAGHPLYGTKRSPETRAKQSASMKARAQDPEWRKLVAEKTKASWRDPEIRQRRITALKGVPRGPMSAETKRKVSLAKKGTKPTPEQRLKLSHAIREAWRKRKEQGVVDGNKIVPI